MNSVKASINEDRKTWELSQKNGDDGGNADIDDNDDDNDDDGDNDDDENDDDVEPGLCRG